MNKFHISFSSSEIDWQWGRQEFQTIPPDSIGGQSTAPALSLGGNVQLGDSDGGVLFPEPIVRRAYRVGPDVVLSRADPGRGYRLYVYAIALSLLRLRTEGFGTFDRPPDTHAYVERSSGVVVHFRRVGNSVTFWASVPNVPEDEMPMLNIGMEELFEAIDQFVSDVGIETRRHVPEAFNWVTLERIRNFCNRGF